MSNDISPETQRKIDMLEQARERQFKLTEISATISQFINGADTQEIKDLGRELCNDHRTLVSRKMELFLSFCEVLDRDFKAGNYDARNEAACKMAGKFLDINFGVTRLPQV